ncbi:MAG: hypothetical protein GX813_02710 [Erysipelotrichia bacterium]|nr:hypothetical protein [Erysipelotrichia bacterium]
MELFLIVLRNVAIALAILYAIIVIIDVAFVSSFCSILAHHDHDLFMILVNKKDACIKLVELLAEKGIRAKRKKVDALTNFDIKRIEHQNGEEAKVAREELAFLVDYFLNLCRESKEVKSLDSFTLVESNLDELDTLYANHVVMYNADVLGFNFWITFYPTRFIYKIFKFKKKNIISYILNLT